MTVYLLAGGGTAGHVNPLLATADEIRRTEPNSDIIVLGTAEGLESRLVPAAGLELATIAKLPFPRALSAAALSYPFRLARAVGVVRRLIRDRHVDVVVGFGGYASAPAYLAARVEKVPIVVHEANAIPGIANKLGALFTRFVGVTFAGTPIANATTVGMPLRREIAELDRDATRAEARAFFGLDSRPVLLVTGGSTGAARINSTVVASVSDIVASGWQVIHTVGESREFVNPNVPGYHPLPYCDRMDLAIAASDFAVSRAGASTVSEFAAVGLPAAYVPYPVGNGEQKFNVQDLVAAGGGILISDAEFTPEFVAQKLVPLISNSKMLRAMSAAARANGVSDGTDRLFNLVQGVL